MLKVYTRKHSAVIAISGILFSACLFISGSLYAQTTPLIRETVGTQLNGQSGNFTVPVYETAQGFDNASGTYRYQGTASVQRSYTSDTYYIDASGKSNLLLDYGNSFILSNIGPNSSLTSLHVYFGLYKSKSNVTSFPNSLVKLEYSTNYNPTTQTGTFTQAAITNINGNSGWQQADAYITVPANATLAFRFSNPSSSSSPDLRVQYRIDDIQAEYTNCADMLNPSIAFLSGSANACSGTGISLADITAYSTQGVKYAWVNNANSNTVLSTNNILPTQNLAVGNHSFTLSVSKADGSCPRQATQAVTIKPNVSASITGGSTSCQNSAPAGITFIGGNGTPPYTFTYKINGGSNQTISTTSGNTVVLSPSTTTTGTFTYSLVSVQDASCTNTASGSTTLTVIPDNSLTLSSGTGSNNQAICSGNAIGAITYSLGGGTTGVNVTGLPAGLSSVVSGSTLTISGTPTAGGTYTVTTVGNSCGNATASGTISINALPTISLSSSDADNTFCSGSNIVFTATTGLSNYNFRVNGSSVQSGSGNTYTTTALTNGQSVNVTVIGSNGCTATSNSISNTVNANPTATLISSDADNTYCTGTSVTFSANSGMSNYNFRINGSTVQNGASNTYTSSSISNGQSVDVVVSNANGCTTPSAAISNTVNSLPNVTLTSNDADNAICTGTSVTFTATSGFTNYNFRVNGASVQNGAGNTYTTSTLGDGQKVDVVATNSGSCTNTSNGITTAVSNAPTMTFTNPSACKTAAVAATANMAYSATTGSPNQYSLVFDVNALLAGFTNVTNAALPAGSIPITIPAGAAAGTYTATLGLSNSVATTCSTNPSAGTVTITVVANPTAPSLTSNDADNRFCIGTAVTFSSTTGFSTYTFQVNGSTVQSSASTSYTSTGITNGQQVTVIGTAASGCQATSAAITNTVYALPTAATITSNDADNSICSGASVTFTGSGTAVSPATISTYTFKINGVNQTNTTPTTYTTTSLANGDVATVLVTDNNGCTRLSSGITTSVNANPSVTLTSNDADNSFCPGTSVTFTASSGYTGYNFRINGVSAQSGSTNTFTTTALTNGQVVDVVVTGIGITACTSTSNGITNTVVSPSITLSSSDADNSFCTGTSVTFTATTGFSTYNFKVAGSTVQNTASNTYTTLALTNGQTVTVVGTNAAGCQGTSNVITNTVNAFPTATLTSSDADNVFCSGTNVTFTVTATTGASYNFRLDGVSKQNGATNTYSNNNMTNGQVVDAIVTSSAGCVTNSNSITNTVGSTNPTMTFTNPSACLGAATANMVYTATSGNPTNYSLTWTSLNAITGGFANVTNAALPSSPIVINIPAGTPRTTAATYTATLGLTNACGVNLAAGTVTLTVNALPTATLTSSDADNSFCSGTSVTFTATAGSTGYNFQVAGATVQNGASNTYTTSALTTGQQVQVIVTSAAGCTRTSSAITNTVLVLPDFTITSIKSCYANRSVLNQSVDFYRGGSNGRLNDEFASTGSGAARVQVAANAGTTLVNNYDYYRDGVLYDTKSAASKNYSDANWGSYTGSAPNLPAGTKYYTISVRCTSATNACTNTKSVQVLFQDIYVPGTSTQVYICTNGTRTGQTVTGTTNTMTNGNAENTIINNSNAYIGSCGEIFSKENLDGSISYEEVKTDDLLAYPNPFNSSLNLRFFVGNAQQSVRFTVSDLLGRSVYTFPVQYFDAAGVYTLNWDGKDAEGIDLKEGVYLIQMLQNDELKTVRVVLTR